MHKKVRAFIIVVLVLLLVACVFEGYMVYKAVTIIQEDGLKSVVHTIWNGANK